MKNLALVLIFLLCPLAVNAQTTLQTGTPIERELAGNQVHEFSVKVEENEYVELVVEQRGIDVIVKLASPSGKILGQFDSPNGSDGSEHVSFVALDAGKYTITVGPLTPENRPSGRYVIKLLEVRQATDEELKTRKNRDVVRARGIALLTEIEGLVPEIKSPHTRIRAQIQAAQILWETDEKRASKLITSAIAELKQFIATIEPDESNYQQYSNVSVLRQEIIQILADRDPDAALDFLYSTNQLINPAGGSIEHSLQESALELTIVDQIAARHPERALQLARKTLKNRYSPNLLGTVMQLHSKNRDLAVELANEIAAKLLGEKMMKDVEAANLAMGLIRLAHETKEQGTDGAKPGVVSEEKAKELLQKLLNEVSSVSTKTQPANPNERGALWNILAGLQGMGPQLDAMAAGSLSMVQKKMMDMNGGINPYAESPEQAMIGANPVEEALEAIGKAPEEMREGLYLQLAHREMNNGQIGRAKQILNDHISNSYARRQVLGTIEQQEIFVAVNSGKIEDALRTIGALRTNRERAGYISQIVARIGPGHKRAEALSFLEQARSLLGPSLQAQDEVHMTALLEIARAFARYDVKRSFDIVEPLLEQFNDLAAAARVLDGFGFEVFQNDELDVQAGSTIGNIGNALAGALGELAVINFDRARLAGEKVRLPEVRLRIYLEIAQTTVKGSGER